VTIKNNYRCFRAYMICDSDVMYDNALAMTSVIFWHQRCKKFLFFEQLSVVVYSGLLKMTATFYSHFIKAPS
jgi:hypothetical protein